MPILKQTYEFKIVMKMNLRNDKAAWEAAKELKIMMEMMPERPDVTVVSFNLIEE